MFVHTTSIVNSANIKNVMPHAIPTNSPTPRACRKKKTVKIFSKRRGQSNATWIARNSNCNGPCDACYATSPMTCACIKKEKERGKQKKKGNAYKFIHVTPTQSTHIHAHAHTYTHTHAHTRTHTFSLSPHKACRWQHYAGKIWACRVSHMNESGLTYGWVRSHIWMSQASYVNESCHMYE